MTSHLNRKDFASRAMDLPTGATAPARFSVSLPKVQNDALNQLVKETGLSKNELLRNAVALLNIAYRGRMKGLNMSLTNEDDQVVSHIVSTV